MIKKSFLFIALIFFSSFVFSQSEPAYKKGTFYAFWGWNKDAYTNSTIHFKGNDYDFTLHDVKASDKQNRWSYHDYLQLNRITIPQTNFRLGYFIKDNLAITLGVDHMKYVMVQDQTVDISGTVRSAFESKVNADNTIKLTDDFLKFEHTDGLNYINSEVEFYRNLYQRGILKINALAGGGAGILLPRTNATLMGQERHDAFHLSGFGLSAKLGVNADLWDLFFLRAEGKEGYINMPDIRTTYSNSDKAKQAFFFAQFVYAFGFHHSF
ncbi:MAG: hypothetical protein QM654_08035 [Dysgonamonadaceae bacterium]